MTSADDCSYCSLESLKLVVAFLEVTSPVQGRGSHNPPIEPAVVSSVEKNKLVYILFLSIARDR